MTTAARWGVVAALVLLLAAVPLAVRAWPAQDRDEGAAQLLERVRRAPDVGWSGYVETRGDLQLPLSSGLDDLGALVGEENRLRVWWRGPEQWRVDRLGAAGETDLVHAGRRTTRWSYEGDRAEVGVDPDVRLPRVSDLVPVEVARRALDDAAASETSRLPARRVAGRDALGLRLTPASPQASIDRVDLWVDADTAVALRVEVHGSAGDDPDFVSEVREFSAEVPAPARTAFEPAPGVEVSFDDVLDIADAADQYAPVVAPPSLAGLPRSPVADRAVGVYGAGLTRVLVVPLRGREAGPLRRQLLLDPTVRTGPEGTLVDADPVAVLLTGTGDDGGWLLTGLVTPATLVAGVEDVAERTTYVGDLVPGGDRR